jgi:hypothetical protein
MPIFFANRAMSYAYDGPNFENLHFPWINSHSFSIHKWSLNTGMINQKRNFPYWHVYHSLQDFNGHMIIQAMFNGLMIQILLISSFVLLRKALVVNEMGEQWPITPKQLANYDKFQGTTKVHTKRGAKLYTHFSTVGSPVYNRFVSR